MVWPWDFPLKNSGVGCRFLPQSFLTRGLNLRLLHWQAGSLPLSHLGRLPGIPLGSKFKRTLWDFGCGDGGADRDVRKDWGMGQRGHEGEHLAEIAWKQAKSQWMMFYCISSNLLRVLGKFRQKWKIEEVHRHVRFIRSHNIWSCLETCVLAEKKPLLRPRDTGPVTLQY